MLIEDVEALYFHLLEQWTRRDAEAMAALFTEDGSVVGFDGSQMNGHREIVSSLRAVFIDHRTPAFVGIIREVRPLGEHAVLIRAVAGMVEEGTDHLNPALNSVQSLVAIQEDHHWRIALFHNTPAAFHGRPEEGDALTRELAALVRERF
jgi:uncharacterized protein (TIGR02246 family)